MTTALTDVFDAQMVDSGDIDVSMYSTLTTGDSWLSMEASMGDDEYASYSATYEYNQGDVEVEMGDDDHPITEYEMADEGGDDVSYEDIQDIEVYDISEFSPSLPIEDYSISADTSGGTTAELRPVLFPVHPQTDPALLLPTPLTVTAELDEFSGEQPVSPEIHPSDAAEAVASVSLAYAATSSAASISGVNLTHSQGFSGVVVTEEAAPFTTSLPVETQEEEVESPDRGVASDLSETRTQPGGETPSSSTLNPPLAEDHHDITDTRQTAEHEDGGFEVLATAIGDPHEISEGVYIDPPPPVLLSLPSSAEITECSLFNLPSSSTPQSPSSSVKPDSGGSGHLLLHDRPTLYYEPISAVFTTLRQESSIQSIPGFSDAELVLDAYDLQLSISEDNVYTHEVTLHELNVIHDGSDLSGPLRLRLKLVIPRFVTRYTTLRDQIARLNLTGDGEAHADVVQEELGADAEFDSQHKTDEEDEVHKTDADAGTTATHNHEPPIQIQQNVEVSSRITDIVEEQSVANVSTVEESEAGDEVANIEGEVTAVEAEKDEEAEDVDPQSEEREDILDADEVHHDATEEGGDYVEHTEFPDDEDDFGEDLPEDFGGEAQTFTDNGFDPTEEPSEGLVFVAPEEYDHDDLSNFDHDEEPGLLSITDTDTLEHFNSIEGDLAQDKLATEIQKHPDRTYHQHADERDGSHHEDIVHHTGDELNDDWDQAEDNTLLEGNPTTLSRKSSTTTLASRTSKRAFEEVDLDDFDDDDFDTAPSSQNTKRPRVQ